MAGSQQLAWLLPVVCTAVALAPHLDPAAGSGRQEVSAVQSAEVSVLDQVMAHRLLRLRDADAVFVACDAFRALGEPTEFPTGLRYAPQLLQSSAANPCAVELPDYPRVHTRTLAIDGTDATVELYVVSQIGAFEEHYWLTKSDLGDTFRVVRVTQQNFSNR